MELNCFKLLILPLFSTFCIILSQRNHESRGERPGAGSNNHELCLHTKKEYDKIKHNNDKKEFDKIKHDKLKHNNNKKEFEQN